MSSQAEDFSDFPMAANNNAAPSDIPQGATDVQRDESGNILGYRDASGRWTVAIAGTPRPAEVGTNAPSDNATAEDFSDFPTIDQASPSFLQQVGRGVGLAGRGALRGLGQLTDLVSAPLKAAQDIGSMIAPGYISPAASDKYTEAADNVGNSVGLPVPQNAAERVNDAAISGATGGMLTAGAASAAAPVSEIASLVGAAPGLDAASGAASGASAQTAKESGSGPVGQFAAAILGGLSPAATKALLQRAAASGVNVSEILQRVADSLTENGAKNQASALLQNSATRPIGEIVENIANRHPSPSGAQPTLAEVAQDPGLAGFQRGHANTDLNTASVIGERNAANALARTKAVDASFGEGNPQSIQDVAATQLSAAEAATGAQQVRRQAAIDSRIESARTAADNSAQAAAARATQAREAVGPIADRTATGAETRQVFEDAYQAAKDRTRQAYNAPELTKPHPITIPRTVFSKVRDAADDFYGDGGGEMPTRLQGIISDLADEHATTRTLTNIDRRLADFAGEARSQGRRSEAAFAERVRSDLGNFVNESAPQAYRDALSNAKAVRAEQGRLFETGAPSQAFATDRFGNASVGDTTVPSRIVRPGAAGGDAIDSLISAIGPDAAEQAARQELRRVIEEGNIHTAAQAASVANRFGEVAKRFPTLQRDLSELQAAAGRVDSARAAQASAQNLRPTVEEVVSLKQRAALHDKIVGTPLARVADPNVDPSTFVSQLLKRADDGRQLRTLISQVQDNPSAASGLRRAFGDFIVRAGRGPNFTAAGEQIPSISKTREAIQTVISRAGPSLSTQQKMVLKAVSRELESANFAATASKPAGSETQLNKSFVEMMKVVPSLPGYAGEARSMLNKLLHTLSNEDEVKRLITQSVLDPDFAANLLKRPTPAHWLKAQQGMAGTGRQAAPIHISKMGIIAGTNPALAREARDLQQRLASTWLPQSAAAQPEDHKK